MRLLPGEPAAGPWRDTSVEDLLELLLDAAGPVSGRPVVIGLDGRASSGKSTLSERLAGLRPGGYAVHTDDVAWFHSAFDWAEELVAGVLGPVRRGEAVRYRPPGWVSRDRPGAVEVPAGLRLLIVEGVGATRRGLAGWLDVTAYVQSDDLDRRARDAARTAAGEISPASAAAWEADEEPFVLVERPWERAAVVVCGTPDQLDLALAEGSVAVADPPGRTLHLLEVTWAAMSAAVVDPDAPTGTEWTAGELLLHLLLDARRALVALASPVTRPADVDAASYWAPFVPGPATAEAAGAHRDHVRAVAAAYSGPDALRREWEETSGAALRALRERWYADPSQRVTTQGHVLSVDDLASTLLVEATVHALDLVAPTGAPLPPPGATAHTRAVLERVLGGPLPGAWGDVDAVRKGTGRAPLDVADRRALGGDADRLPLLG